jgi:stage V sporulation protein G
VCGKRRGTVEITEIRVKLMEDRSEKLQAFCTVTLDHCFVIRDLKIIDGQRGPFVAMPSRKLTDRCPKCSAKNHLRARYCNECGVRLDINRAARDEHGRSRLHTDIAHPINAACRQRMQDAILEAFAEEVKRSKLPGYKPVNLGADYDEGFADEDVVTLGNGRVPVPGPDRAERQPAGASPGDARQANQRAGEQDSIEEGMAG